MALREHYRTDTSPCSINEKWDCGIVNHSPYAVLWGVPVATIGIVGYLLLGALALKRWYSVLLPLCVGSARVLPLSGPHRSPPSGRLVHLLRGIIGRDFSFQPSDVSDSRNAGAGEKRNPLRTPGGIKGIFRRTQIQFQPIALLQLAPPIFFSAASSSSLLGA